MSAFNSRTALAGAIAMAASFGAQASEPIALGVGRKAGQP